MPPPARTSPPRADIPFEPPIRQDSEPIPIQEEVHAEAVEDVKNEGDDRFGVGAADTAPASSIFSSLLPRADLSRHFPFGHGIGSEELLILAVMLMVFLSGNERGEVDSEFLLLLGLLLFAG